VHHLVEVKFRTRIPLKLPNSLKVALPPGTLFKTGCRTSVSPRIVAMLEDRLKPHLLSETLIPTTMNGMVDVLEIWIPVVTQPSHIKMADGIQVLNTNQLNTPRTITIGHREKSLVNPNILESVSRRGRSHYLHLKDSSGRTLVYMETEPALWLWFGK
jgi:hypothetical protein